MKKTISLLLVVAVIASALCSCTVITNLAAKNATARTLKRTRLLIDSCGKEVILLPMCHIGKQERYDEMHAYLDSLKADGYVTFFEGPLLTPFHTDTINDLNTIDIAQIIRETGIDSLKNDTLRRKMRRIIGFDPTTRYAKYKRLAKQSIEGLGMTTERDIFTDYSIYDLIERYEQRCGSVLLSDYDFEIDVTDPKYKVSKAGGIGRKWTFLTYFRDKLLLRRILESSHRKIAVVYGSGHISPMKHTLRFFEGFTLDKKYNAKKAYPAK